MAQGSGLPIPLVAASAVPGEFHFGTGFLGQRLDGQIGLFTAAHMPTKSQPVRTPNWVGWPGSIHAFTSVSETVEVSLFSGTGELRLPLFSYLEGNGMKLADMMGFVGPAYTGVIAALTARYEVAKLVNAEVWGMTSGQELACLGYPLLGGGAKWPYAPASMTTGPFRGIGTGPMFEADIVTEEGFSGGPVITDGGPLVGMMIGNTDGVARIVPGELLATLRGPVVLARTPGSK